MEEAEQAELPQTIVVQKRGRGRPKGSKNRFTQPRPELTISSDRIVPPTSSKADDFAHADIDTMLSRQLSLVSWAQQALRIKMFGGVKSAESALDELRAKKIDLFGSDMKELLDLSNALARVIEALKKHADLADELAKRMSAEQLLEAAIKKIEGQSLPTVNYAIKRLRAKREMLAPVTGLERHAIGSAEKDDERATDAIASLLTE